MVRKTFGSKSSARITIRAATFNNRHDPATRAARVFTDSAENLSKQPIRLRAFRATRVNPDIDKPRISGIIRSRDRARLTDKNIYGERYACSLDSVSKGGVSFLLA